MKKECPGVRALTSTLLMGVLVLLGATTAYAWSPVLALPVHAQGPASGPDAPLPVEPTGGGGSQCHQNTVGVPSSLGVVEVCSQEEVDALAAAEESSVCVDLNAAEAPCSGTCPTGCGCIVENVQNPRNGYRFKKTCTAAGVAGCPGDAGFVCDFGTVSYDCPCVCRPPGDPGGNFAPGCKP